jgi:peptide/nickel transport system substrate-binding protein
MKWMSAYSRLVSSASVAGLLLLAACAAPAAAPTAAPKPTTAPASAPTTAPTPAPTAAPAAAAKPAAAPTSGSTAAAAAPTTSTAPAATSSLTGTLKIDTISEIESPHPFFASQLVGISVRMNLFDSLVERDFEGKIVPGLATSWNVVDDKTIDFTLRQGVKFHNGQTMTADDVKASMDHELDKSIKAPSTSIFASVQGIDVVDPQTVRLTLLKTDARIFDLLANNFAVMPAQYIKDVGADGIAKHPIGTGPYMFVEWVKDDHLTLEANPNYWDGSYKGKPQVKTIILRPVTDPATRLADLRSGAADIIMDVPTDQVAALKSAGFNVVEENTVQQDFVFMDTTKDTPLKSKEVRQALNYAVDKDSLVNDLLGGYATPLDGPVSSLVLGHNANVHPYPYDTAKARSLLAAGGVPNGFTIDMDITSSTGSTIGEAIAAQLADIGVNVNLNVLETAVFNDRWVKRTLDPMYFNRWATFSDPALLDLLAGCKGFLSSSCDQDAQQYLDAGGATLDQSQRDTAYQQAVQMLADDPFAIYLHQLKSLTGTSSKVSGWKPHGTAYLILTNAKLSN